MDHDERLALAGMIAQKLLENYGERIVAVAAWGSVAQGADTEHSDLELWAATDDALPQREVSLIQRGIAVQVSLLPVARALADAATVTQYWPIDAARWRDCLPLFERADFFARLREASGCLPDEGFDRAIRERMVRLHEVGGKVRSSRARGDRYGLLKAGRDLTHNAAIIIGLANRQHYPNTRDLYQLSTRMALRPDGYADLLDDAGGFATVDPARVYAAATALWASLQAFVRGMGIEWEDDELRL
jgi:kanamycin nucleotidyltransferase